MTIEEFLAILSTLLYIYTFPFETHSVCLSVSSAGRPEASGTFTINTREKSVQQTPIGTPIKIVENSIQAGPHRDPRDPYRDGFVLLLLATGGALLF